MNSIARNDARPSAYPAEWDVAFRPAAPLPEGYKVGRETKHL